MAELEIPVTQEEYEKAGSKFMTMPPGAKLGDNLFLDIEIGMIDWDNVGASMKVPVTVLTEGPDKGKEDKISFGVKADGIWKGKDIYKAITGEDMPMKEGTGGKIRPFIDPMALVGKVAVGQWVYQRGYSGGDKTLPPTDYPKLMNILPAGTKPQVEDLGMG